MSFSRLFLNILSLELSNFNSFQVQLLFETICLCDLEEKRNKNAVVGKFNTVTIMDARKSAIFFFRAEIPFLC